MKCILCGAAAVDKLCTVGQRSTSVTSDSKLVSVASEIHGCRSCGHLQKEQAHQSLVDRVYKTYDAHHLSAGNEQPVFDGRQPGMSRSEYVLARLIDHLPENGKLLDIGTGNGAVLKTAHRLLPEWDLFAFDIEDRFEKEILRIPKVREFHCGDLDLIPKKQFDLIVLWHVLEHVREPVPFLKRVGEMVSNNGFIVAQVPDVARNPFDLAVIDHCSHFSSNCMAYLVSRADLETVVDGSEWVHNCITVMVQKADATRNPENSKVESTGCFSQINWVNASTAMLNERVAATSPGYYLFGTGMASLFLFSQLSYRPLAFIDEDPHKAGCNIEGIDIISPEQAAPDRPIVLPFIPLTSKKIKARLVAIYQNIAASPFIIPETNETSGCHGIIQAQN